MKAKDVLHNYLPHGMKCQWSDGKITTINCEEVGINYAESTLAVYLAYFSIGNELKPIFYPLSMLTKEIEHKGERFVPFDTIQEQYVNGEFEISRMTSSTFHLTMDSWDSFNGYLFEIWQTLFEWRFDIFSLIPNGEAIDVTTLETNPYQL